MPGVTSQEGYLIGSKNSSVPSKTTKREHCTCAYMCVHSCIDEQRILRLSMVHVCACYILQKGQLFVVGFNKLTSFWLNGAQWYLSSNEQGRGTLISCLANY